MATVQTLLRALVCLMLVACDSDRIPLPEATPAQIAREQEFIRVRFSSDPCFIAAVERANIFGGEASKESTYSIEVPPSALMHDGVHYLVSVRKTDRMATVTRTGGYFGINETLGPMPLSACLQPVFTAG